MKNEYPTMNKVNNTPEKRTMQQFEKICSTAVGLAFWSGVLLVLLWFYFDIPFGTFWKQYLRFTFPWFILWAIRSFLPSFFTPAMFTLCAWQFRHLVRYGREQWVLQYQNDPVAAAAAGPFPVSGLLEWSIFVNILLFGLIIYACQQQKLQDTIKE